MVYPPCGLNVHCIVSQKKNVKTIQGNILIAKYILNVFTNVFASVPTLHFLTMQSIMFELKTLIQPIRGQRNI